MTSVSAIFFDLGGVLLSNGWDRVSRRVVVDELDLDWDEFSDRHDFVVEAFETGRISLDGYLDRTVFYRERSFGPGRFKDLMRAQSYAHEDALGLVNRLKGSGGYLLATLNNESAELNQFRIDHFGLRNYFDLFLSSSILGIKKPDARIYRLAMDITQRRPEECLFVDDRPLNLECAADEGFRTVAFTDVEQLEQDLAEQGVTW